MKKSEEKTTLQTEGNLEIEPIKTPLATKPILLLIVTTISIFLGEGLVMLVLMLSLPHLPPMNVFSTALLDASLLTMVVTPALYLFLFRPMRLNIAERKRVETEQKRLIGELSDALKKVKVLSGLLPICASCKKIRNENGSWSSLEKYISERSNAGFTHSICPECEERLYPEISEK